MVWLQVCARVLLTVAVVIAAATFADRWLSPDGTPLLVLAIVVLLASPRQCRSALVWPHRRAPDDLRVARFVEERCPELDDAIVDGRRPASVERRAAPPSRSRRSSSSRPRRAFAQLDLGRIVSADAS